VNKDISQLSPKYLNKFLAIATVNASGCFGVEIIAINGMPAAASQHEREIQ